MSQETIDRANSEFWREMCGTAAARNLGITGIGPDDLKKFDAWFFEFYPYLDQYVRFDRLRGRKVLEVGLGYGTISQRIAESGGQLTGFDISNGPVEFLRHRLRQSGLPGRAEQGSILAAPFENETFDTVVSIGCIHHTGNMERAISEIARILKPGGDIVLMVYNAASYLQLIRRPSDVIGYLTKREPGRRQPLRLDERGRKEMDANTDGIAAPETVAVTARHFGEMLKEYFVDVRCERQNAVPHYPLNKIASRATMLRTVGPILGLDVYATAKKPANSNLNFKQE